MVREHDLLLQAHLNGVGQQSSGLVLLLGASCSGKTRAAFEAVNACLPDWPLICPRSVNDLTALPDGPAVVWLDDLHSALGDDQDHAGEGMARALLTLLDSSPHVLILVAMIWTHRYTALTTQPKGNEPDKHPHARALLAGATEIPVTDVFTPEALARFSAAAADDPDWLLAACSARADGDLTQTLAGAVDLSRRYDRADHTGDPAGPFGKALVTAAVDARRLGYRGALPVSFLQAAVPAYLTPRQRRDATGQWEDDALEWADHKVKNVASALTPVLNLRGMGAAPDLRNVHDFLEQRLSEGRAGVFPPASFWSALDEDVVPGAALVAMATAAMNCGRFQTAAQLLHRAVVLGPATEAFESLCNLYVEIGRIDTRTGLDELLGALSNISDDHASAGHLGWLLTNMETSRVAVEYEADRAVLAERLLRSACESGQEYAAHFLYELLEHQGRAAEIAAAPARAEKETPQEPERHPAEAVLRAIGHEPGALEALEALVTRGGPELDVVIAGLQRFDVQVKAWPTALAELGAESLALSLLRAGVSAGAQMADRNLIMFLERYGSPAEVSATHAELAASSDRGFFDYFHHFWSGGQHRKAVALLNRARRENRIAAVRLVVKSLLKRHGTARRTAEDVLRRLIADGHAAVAYDLAVAIADRHDPDELPAEVESLLDIAEPYHPDASRLLGQLAMNRNNFPRAQRCFLTAADRGDSSVLTDGWLGSALFPHDSTQAAAVGRFGITLAGEPGQPW
ncbi:MULTISPECIES: hypothetical protein [Streptomyces]|uniref:hypothetical protein n=1 Tax=Streptomyces TaxID=1883 RepID=UPI00068A44D4|nr:hypothetical protein [Streptomyces griseolus]